MECKTDGYQDDPPVKSLSEALHDELLETIDEELELEFDDQRLDSVSGPRSRRRRAGDALDRRTYFRELLRLQTGIDQAAGLGRPPEAQIGRAVRGPRRGRQRRRDQAHHPAAQSAHLQGRGAVGADRARAHPVVFPALCLAPAGGRRNRAVRPQLVQPRRRRTGHGLLHRSGVRGVFPHRAGIRADAGALRHHSREILVLDHRSRSRTCAF